MLLGDKGDWIVADISMTKILIILIFFLVLANVLIVSYSKDKAKEYLLSTNVSEDSNSVFNSGSSALGTLEALKITTTVVLPWWATFLFFFLPNFGIVFAIVLVLRGTWQ